jgi:hypothetical protein
MQLPIYIGQVSSNNSHGEPHIPWLTQSLLPHERDNTRSPHKAGAEAILEVLALSRVIRRSSMQITEQGHGTVQPHKQPADHLLQWLTLTAGIGPSHAWEWTGSG